MSNSEYWFFRFLYSKRYLITAISIVFIAALIRFYKLGEIPHGLTWDETAIGYNGYAILTTRRDEWLNFLPVSFKSFGDFKAPMAIYLNGPFTAVAGLTPFGVRLPFALSGVMAVVGLMLLIKELWSHDKHAKFFALAAGAILTFSPWHIHFTRTGFESGLMLTMVIFGLLFLRLGLTSRIPGRSLLFTGSAFILFAFSFYTYHSAKVSVPLLVPVFLLFHWRYLKAHKLQLAFGIIAGLLLMVPLIKDTFWGEGLERAGVTVFARSESLTEAILLTGKQFLIHLSPRFLLFGESTTMRHGDGTWGVLFLTTALGAITGFIAAIKGVFRAKRHKKAMSQKTKLGILFLFWVALGLLPAAIATEIPHSNRSLMALPGFIGLAMVGLDFAASVLRRSKLNQTWNGSKGEKNLLVKAAIGSAALFHFVFFFAYANHYLNVFAAESAGAFQDGYLETLELVKSYEKEVSSIIISSKYGQPYIYTLFAKQVSPIAYNGGVLVSYLFPDSVSISDLNRENSLIVATAEDEVPFKKADHLVYGSDGEIRFALFITDNAN